MFKFNGWESVSQFINGYLNCTHMYYMCVVTFVKSALCSSNNVLSRLANLYIKCSDFGHHAVNSNECAIEYAYICHKSICSSTL